MLDYSAKYYSTTLCPITQVLTLSLLYSKIILRASLNCDLSSLDNRTCHKS
jgi:hypothetical protein